MTTMDTGWRSAQTQHGDTLAAIAARELSDAARWPDLAWLNRLLPPYLTGNAQHPGVLAGKVILWGGNIRIPLLAGTRQEITPDESFGVDVRLNNGRLETEGGDIALVRGVQNLRQALEMRLRSNIGSLLFHPRYGNAAGQLRGQKSGQGVALLALRFCEECLLGDPRVVAVRDGIAQAVGDLIRVEITAVADDSSPLRLQLEL